VEVAVYIIGAGCLLISMLTDESRISLEIVYNTQRIVILLIHRGGKGDFT
jgi:hypothetical protein